MPPQPPSQETHLSKEQRLFEIIGKKEFEMPPSRRARIYGMPESEAVRFTSMSTLDFAIMLEQSISDEGGRVVGFRKTRYDLYEQYEYLTESLQWEYVALAREETDPFEDVPVFPLRVRAATGQVQQ